MNADEPNGSGTVRYTVKELFARIDGKLDKALEALDQKANDADLDALELRVSALENARAESRGFGRGQVAILGALLTIVGLLIPIVLHVT